jgi:hypothetical protein
MLRSRVGSRQGGAPLAQAGNRSRTRSDLGRGVVSPHVSPLDHLDCGEYIDLIDGHIPQCPAYRDTKSERIAGGHCSNVSTCLTALRVGQRRGLR